MGASGSQALWRQSQADLETARLLLTAERFYAASWFAQQAVEKGLKTLLLIERGNLPPRTHDLEFLGIELNIPEQLASDLSQLNPAFGIARYPDPMSLIAPVDAVAASTAHQHLDCAERILTWLSSRLDRQSQQPSRDSPSDW
jgi:HEPN domain-containing protein